MSSPAHPYGVAADTAPFFQLSSAFGRRSALTDQEGAWPRKANRHRRPPAPSAFLCLLFKSQGDHKEHYQAGEARFGSLALPG